MIRRALENAELTIGEGDSVEEAVVAAQAEAVRRHRLLGVPMVIWRDGQIVEVSAHEIPIPGECDPHPNRT